MDIKMKKEEYRVLKYKYMNQGLNSFEAHKKVGLFVDILKDIRMKMKCKHKTEQEIKIKLEEEFQREFAKLN